MGVVHRGQRTVLFIVEAVTLAHEVRSSVLAEGLRRAGYRVLMACRSDHSDLIGATSVPRLSINSISSKDFLSALRDGKRLYDLKTLRRYVREDREIMDRCRPDLVIGDFRLSLSVSSRQQGVPYATVTNAHWSPGSNQPNVMPEHPITRRLGVGIGRALGSVAKPIVTQHMLHPFNRLRRNHGMAPYRSLEHLYTEADHTLYVDDPAVVSVDALPPGHTYLGPVQWAPKNARPVWWNRVPEDRPIVYLTLGSSGPSHRIPGWLRALERAPYTFLVSTAGQTLPGPVPTNVFVAPYLAGDEACRRADVMVCNGGSGSIYQALAEGTPVVGVCSNMDQHLVMSHAERAGVGVTLRSEHADGDALTGAISRVLREPRFGARARLLGARVASADPVAALLGHVDRWMGCAQDVASLPLSGLTSAATELQGAGAGA